MDSRLRNNKIIEGTEEWVNPRKKVVLDQSIGTRGFKKVAELACTYADLKHFFGNPITLLNHPDRRVEWGFREEETGIGATIYDNDKEIPLNETFTWAVGGSEDRSLEMIGQIFQQELDKGVKFVSKPLPQDGGAN